MKAEPNEWLVAWIASVDEGSMTQRRLTSVARHGGVAELERLARSAGVHLLQLTDDAGHEVIAASRRPFKVLC